LSSKLNSKIEKLERENTALKKRLRNLLQSKEKKTVRSPAVFNKVFKQAEKTVGSYFSKLKLSPSKGTIEISGERYVLVRASALSFDFLNAIKDLYKDRGQEEAMTIGKNILFDMAHLIGLEDAKTFHKKMKLSDPIQKLAAGPVHFAYSGWAFVEILSGSNPSPDENFVLKYNHPFSFEADSWIKAGKKADTTVCIMNSGYSSGWCEASFGISLTSVEITCKARGDANCTFIMAPPDKINKYLPLKKSNQNKISVPTFLERKQIEEKLRSSIKEKEFLIKEIHHRVKNNLQIISSLLNLQLGTINDKASAEKFRESIGRVKSMAIIHELLYQTNRLSEIKAKNYLNELVQFIHNSYRLDKKIKVELKIDAAIKRIDMNRAIPCGLIINELLSNSYKHAFKNINQGKIKIELKVEPTHKLPVILRVSDNGSGMKLDKKMLDSPETLGLQLVQALVLQLGGELTVKSNAGTSFEIRFK